MQIVRNNLARVGHGPGTSSFDLGLLLVLGLLGYAMRRFGIPVLPLIIGVILGPRLEEQLSEALEISRGDCSTLWGEPTAIVCYVIVALVLAWTIVNVLRPKRDSQPVAADDREEVSL